MIPYQYALRRRVLSGFPWVTIFSGTMSTSAITYTLPAKLKTGNVINLYLQGTANRDMVFYLYLLSGSSNIGRYSIEFTRQQLSEGVYVQITVPNTSLLVTKIEIDNAIFVATFKNATIKCQIVK